MRSEKTELSVPLDISTGDWRLKKKKKMQYQVKSFKKERRKIEKRRMKEKTMRGDGKLSNSFALN